uniref:Uncharacterized protein n=1 Tax=Arundo donax TaxID=35708 RepID=A0A0A9ELC7_ARUDO
MIAGILKSKRTLLFLTNKEKVHYPTLNYELSLIFNP